MFGEILGATSSLNADRSACVATFLRNLPIRVKGRPATILNLSSFCFESLGRDGKALNVGTIPLLTNEVDPLIRSLNREGIIVSRTAVRVQFEVPSLTNIYFQAVENPILFAIKVAKVLQENKITRSLAGTQSSPAFQRLCQRFVSILDGFANTTFPGVCISFQSRDFPVRISGKPVVDNIVKSVVAGFESLSSDGKALCLADVTLLTDEVQPFIRRVRQQTGFMVASITDRFLSIEPTLSYVFLQTIANPILFANQLAAVLPLQRAPAPA
ncbi:DUF1259 domain-containing protein [Mechercharimyces sp. CAU 1602]|uniref:DUF1259 domain-containing protein n=1 Tax=Mechercharimyces sp. CAU 1602 TaxID=2973933 RepID=UPI002161ADA6|nr:DUF1259 domain-containing protein [Mechercharimyces sp. CAU 1602]MCS1352058.1 DUF1259 domain-containing protein [Mechercharimyces sp. CAU 1602]